MNKPQLLSALVRIPLDRVVPGSNARGDVGDVNELAMSIKALGMRQPMLVSDIGDGRYRVLDGHRRLAAAKLLGLAHVDAVLRRDAGGAVRIQQQLAMHAQARAFDPIAEAEALSTLMFEHKLPREEIARAIGKSPGWVRDRLGLLQLKEDEQESVRQGRMSIADARATVVNRRRGDWAEHLAAPAAHLKRHCATCSCAGRGA